MSAVPTAAVLTAARPAADTSVRSDWVDAAKGLGIVLVVLGHVIGGVRDAGVLPTPAHPLELLHYAIYTFHMPLFFLIGGLFVARRVARDGADFVTANLRRLLYPYVLWSVVQLAVIHAAGNAVNTPTPLDASRLVALIWSPTSQFWYLHALFLMHVGAVVCLPRQGVAGLFLLALALLGLQGLLTLPEAAVNVCRFFVFYATGVALGSQAGGSLGMPRLGGGPALAAGAVWVALVVVAHRSGFGYWDLAVLPVAVLGLCAVLGLAQRPAVRRTAVLAYLGRQSMPIFLLHVLFCAGTRIVLTRLLERPDPYLLTACATAAGLLGPVLAHEAARRLRLASALGFE